MTLSKCCDAKADTDIMICSDCLEHLGDEDIWDDEVVKYYNPRNKLGVEWDVVPTRWSNGVPFGGTNSATKEMYMEKMMEIESTCPDCDGTGEMDARDESKINSTTIIEPFHKVKCEKCEGEGVI